MPGPFNILLLSRTKACRHNLIPAGSRALYRLAEASASGPHPFRADDTEDPAVFDPESLAKYRVIVLLQCLGEFLDDASQLDALQGFVRSGGGVVAVHCASFAMKSSEWYGGLIGAVFDNHPDPQEGRVRILDKGHPIMTWRCSTGMPSSADDADGAQQQQQQQQQPSERTWWDEWYNFKTHPRTAAAGDGNNLDMLLAVDEASYERGQHGADYPIAWCQTFDGGRCFYTSLGHFDEAYEDKWFVDQLLGAILWTAGLA